MFSFELLGTGGAHCGVTTAAVVVDGARARPCQATNGSGTNDSSRRTAQDERQVPLVEDDHLIETLTSQRADHPFDERALPQRARRRQHLLDAECRDAPVEGGGVDSISVSQQVTRRRIPGKGLDDLLRCPPGRRIFRDVEMHDTTPIVPQDDEDEQPLKVAVGSVKKSTDTRSGT